MMPLSRLSPYVAASAGVSARAGLGSVSVAAFSPTTRSDAARVSLFLISECFADVAVACIFRFIKVGRMCMNLLTSQFAFLSEIIMI